MQNESILQIGKLIVTDNGFVWENQQYSFDSISHLTFYWEVYSNSVNNVKTTTEKALLDITLVNQNNIHIGSGDHGIKSIIGGKMFSNFASEKAQHDCKLLSRAYQILSEKSFNQRYLYYANQLKKSGYFIYDSNYFFHDGRVLSRKKGEFKITDNPKFGAFSLILSKSQKTSFQKFADVLWNNIYDLTISTKIDKDVFHYLFNALLKTHEE